MPRYAWQSLGWCLPCLHLSLYLSACLPVALSACESLCLSPLPHNLSCLRVCVVPCVVPCTHAQMLLPFAIGNGVTAMALYGILDKSAGGPERLAALNYDMGSFVSVPVVGKAQASFFLFFFPNLFMPIYAPLPTHICTLPLPCSLPRPRSRPRSRYLPASLAVPLYLRRRSTSSPPKQMLCSHAKHVCPCGVVLVTARPNAFRAQRTAGNSIGVEKQKQKCI